MTQQEIGMDPARMPQSDDATSEEALAAAGDAPESLHEEDVEEVSDDQLVEGLVEEASVDEDGEEMLEGVGSCSGCDDGAEEADEDGAEDDAEEGDEDDDSDGEVMTDMDSVVEAILFAADEPMTPSRLVSVVEAGSTKQVRRSVKSLNKKYARTNCAFRIEEIAGGFQMMTLPAYNPWLRKLVRVRTDNKLTQAALETLAIIAYKQPLIRADIEAIRGVASGEVIRNLMYKGLVKIVGRAEVLGRPMLYGTTRRFLDVFGLSSLKDLPNVEELKKPD